MRSIVIFGVIILLLGASGIVSSISTVQIDRELHSGSHQISSNVIIVDNEGDGDFLSIQMAIDTAMPGDIIRVYSGIYNENISINIENIVVEGKNFELGSGDDDDFPVIFGDSEGDVVSILSKNISISGFIIQNSGRDYYNAGIGVYSSNNLIYSNGIVGNFYGIVIIGCSRSEIKENYITSNVMDGVYLMFTDDNIISNNLITENGFQGIFLYETYGNSFDDNTIFLNGKDGIHFRNFCTDNIVTGNTIHSNNIDGIKLKESDVINNIFSGNSIYSNRYNGIHVMYSNNNEFYENEINLNLLNGIHLGDADNNIICRNTIQNNNNKAIVILWAGSQDNLIYHNNIINDNALDNGNNKWDNDYPSGGNYWSYYSGPDDDGDGIGDTPYNITGASNQDRYPFIEPLYPPNTPLRPTGQLYGEVGTEYEYFTSTIDLNLDKIQYGWDWDGDKNVDEWTDFYDSVEICNVSHSWSQEGTYKIYVIAMDEYGLKSQWSNPLSVSMPRNKAVNRPFLQVLQNFLQNHPLIYQLLLRLLKL